MGAYLVIWLSTLTFAPPTRFPHRHNAALRMSAQDSESVEAPKSEKDTLKDEIARVEQTLVKARGTLAQKKDDLKSKGENGYMLLAADFERFRIESRGQLDQQKKYATMDALRPLLPAFETFANLQTEAETAGEDAGTVHKYYAGIYKQLLDQIQKDDVQSFEAEVGDQYDWRRHSELERRASDTVATNCVLEVVSKGYTVGGEVLRACGCVISSGPVADEVDSTSEGEAQEEEEEEEGQEGEEETTSAD